jgi:hypothetical protein
MFYVGFECPYFRVYGRTEKSLYVIYNKCNVVQRTKIYKDFNNKEYAKYNNNIIYPFCRIRY